MAKWPKKMLIKDAPVAKDNGVYEVIPADIGRELYEALKEVESAATFSTIREALARYEREVGSPGQPTRADQDYDRMKEYSDEIWETDTDYHDPGGRDR